MNARLEDDFTDVIDKSQQGLKIDDTRLATMAGISVEQLEALKNKQVDDHVLERIAPVLGLSAQPLLDLAHQRWYPAACEVHGLARFESPGGAGSMVNSFLVWDPATLNAACFDTGTDAMEMLRFVVRNNLRLQLILITHSHSDHIAALQSVLATTDATAFATKDENMRGVETFEPGHNFVLGNLIITTRACPGHSRGGVTYVVGHLERKIAIVGDSLFAGSVGRPFHSYQVLLKSNLEKILSLPEDTVLCPGHGPMTTVGEEKLHNPFFASELVNFAKAA